MANSSAGAAAHVITHQRQAEIIAGLNASLANLTDLAGAAKQAHWNVRGPNFHGLHDLFDTIAAEVRDYADSVAERATALGGTAHGTIQDAVTTTRLAPFPTDAQSPETLVRELCQRMKATAARMRDDVAGLADEPITQDLYVGIIRGLEMRQWMLDAHLG